MNTPISCCDRPGINNVIILRNKDLGIQQGRRTGVPGRGVEDCSYCRATVNLPGGKAQHQMFFIVDYSFAVFIIQNNRARNRRIGSDCLAP